MNQHHDLARIARAAMAERGFLPDFGPDVEREVARMAEPDGNGLRDLNGLLWFSIDNDDSRDLDQISWAEERKDGSSRLLVGIADVDALVAKGSACDGHARANTTSVYTGVTTFPMLPQRLSFDLTSLNEGEERHAIVIEMVVAPDGTLDGSDVYRALVTNKAKLAYASVAAWLEGGEAPPKVAESKELQEQIRLQDRLAQRLRAVRHAHGALELASTETRPVFDDGTLVDMAAETQNRAQELIEDLMVAANGVSARFLAARKVPSLRRVVKTPARWERIVALAEEHGEKLPAEPDAPALSQFLKRMRAKDPVRFPDLSLSVVKLMGPGEYVVERPGQAPIGHFGLAVRDYTHSTAPNRRYPDLITQRLLKAALNGGGMPYGGGELDALAQHCTEREDEAQKVERRVRKSAAALLLEPRIGETFDGIVTGAADKGTWVRIFRPPAEGRVVHGASGMDVGERVRVKLVSTDVERGYIDFARAKR